MLFASIVTLMHSPSMLQISWLKFTKHPVILRHPKYTTRCVIIILSLSVNEQDTWDTWLCGWRKIRTKWEDNLFFDLTPQSCVTYLFVYRTSSLDWRVIGQVDIQCCVTGSLLKRGFEKQLFLSFRADSSEKHSDLISRDRIFMP
jgi:hypothetical protein